jgi:1-acyl-sn-glycerol-3-phosphate acyltransferase
MADKFEDRFSPEFFQRTGRLLDALTRFYFRYRLRGLERIPPTPCLLVGNHSALGTMELMCMLGAWWRHFGTRRRVTGLMHDFFLNSPGIGHYYRAIGAVPASRENAVVALKAGHDVLVFPGGDLDACRPFYQPRGVHFGPRRGYIRIALQAGVPVVPVATIGSHYTMLMAPGGAWLARILGLKKLLRTERVPLPLHLWPPPVRITSEALPAMDVIAAAAGMEDEAARVERAHELVYGAIRDAVANMRPD